MKFYRTGKTNLLSNCEYAMHYSKPGYKTINIVNITTFEKLHKVGPSKWTYFHNRYMEVLINFARKSTLILTDSTTSLIC